MKGGFDVERNCINLEKTSGSLAILSTTINILFLMPCNRLWLEWRQIKVDSVKTLLVKATCTVYTYCMCQRCPFSEFKWRTLIVLLSRLKLSLVFEKCVGIFHWERTSEVHSRNGDMVGWSFVNFFYFFDRQWY